MATSNPTNFQVYHIVEDIYFTVLPAVEKRALYKLWPASSTTTCVSLTSQNEASRMIGFT
jgi:hypothetical protein